MSVLCVTKREEDQRTQLNWISGHCFALIDGDKKVIRYQGIRSQKVLCECSVDGRRCRKYQALQKF